VVRKTIMAEKHEYTTESKQLDTDILDASPKYSDTVRAADEPLSKGKEDGSGLTFSATGFGGVGEVFDPFVPFPHDPGVVEGENILRARSIVLGVICGSLVNASNIYLGKPHDI
jgi:hypothetical protein